VSEFKVVDIVSPSKIVINAGTRDDIRSGQLFLVYRLGNDITDPDTGEALGRPEIPRGVGRVISVQERLSVLESIMESETFRLLSGSTGMERTRLPFDGVQIGDMARRQRVLGMDLRF
jgi:hypothetical protein